MSTIDARPLLGWNAGGEVDSIAVSHDSSRVASGSDDYLVRIWDLHTGALVLNPLEGHTDFVRSVAWSHDNACVASGSRDHTIRIWDTHSGALIGEPITGHTNWIDSVVFSSDSTLVISGSRDNTIRIWDSKTGALIREPLMGHLDVVWSVMLSPDNTRIVSGSGDKTTRLWDASTSAPIGRPLTGHTLPVYSVAFSHDGTRIVSGSYDSSIRIWDAWTGAPIGEPLRGHTHSVRSVAFSPDSTLIVSGSYDNTVRIWNALNGTPVGKPLREHIGSVCSVTFSPDGSLLASGSADYTIRTWEAPQCMPSFDMVTSKMTAQEMFECLVQHGCVDLTSTIDPDQSTSVVVASGGFGDVRRMTIAGTPVAIKTLRLHVLLKDNDKAAKRAVREVYIWSKLHHVNVQELLGIVVFQGGLGMVSPWMGKGNLQQYIAAYPEVERYSLCVQVASSVSYLHRIGMTHGDLKANNVLVSNDGILKINDFDHAMLPEGTLRFSATTRNGGGTLRWMAPELLQPEHDESSEAETAATGSEQTDVYALGMTMLEIITGDVPYAEYRSDMGIYRAIHNKQPPRRPKELLDSNERSEKMWSLLLNCWDHNPAVRPDALTVEKLLEFRRSTESKRATTSYVMQGRADLSGTSTSAFSRLKQIYRNLAR